MLVQPVTDNDGNETTGNPTTIVTAGEAFGVRLTLQDQFDNTATNYGDTAVDVTWSSTAGDALDGTPPTIPADSTIDLTDGVAEVAGFTLTRVEAGVTISAALDADRNGTFNDPVGATPSDPVFVEGINLDSEGYHTGGTVIVTVGDDSENAESTVAETTSIRATSTTISPDEIIVALTETGVDTGIFDGSFDLVSTTPGTGELLISTGDTITITYPTDSTLQVAPLNEAIVDDVAPVFAGVDPVVADATFYKNTDMITLTADIGETSLTVTADFSSIDSEYTAGDETATDVGGGIYTITYTIAETNTVADGEYPIGVTAEDVAGNMATDASCAVTLDNTAPVVTEPTADPSVIQPATATNVVLTASVTDGEGAGVLSVTIDLTEIGLGAEPMLDDGVAPDVEALDGIYTVGLSALSVAVEGTYALPITATDSLDNVNDTGVITLRVIADTTAPDITDPGVFYPVGYESARSGDPVVIYASVTDALSGVEEVTVDATEIGLTASEAMELADTDIYVAELQVQAGIEPGTKTLTITAADYATNEVTADVTVEVVAALTAYNIWLNDGLNLISLPLIPEDSSIEVVLAGLSSTDGETIPSILSVWGYDDGWQSYVPGGPPPTLTQMTDGSGYWIDVEYAVDAPRAFLTIHGTELPVPPALPPAYGVVTGWNLIGFKKTHPMPAREYLAGIDESVVRIYGFYDGAYFIVRLDQPPPMQPGLGYWLAVTEPGTIYP